MSRAIGDHYLRPYVIAEPEANEVLVLATDGLWDVFSCKEATTLAMRCIVRSKERGMSRHGACRVAASVLTKVALERGSRDNITVIVQQQQPHPSFPACTSAAAESWGCAAS
ncbi:PPM-type phosphatase domain-containing protein [Haematococcus lacustris]|uniref:PPM-type phosphatase domain-containing protein n=1 Tax=Haematococcus lacustris TaxID=44745 RepID=A0A699YX27_HAELA|nr:PPM-type phosphatase domain-containing protein [Haematococcus lacustris]